MSGIAKTDTLPQNCLLVNDYVQIAYNTARFLNSRNPGFIIGTGLFKECVDLLVPGANTSSVAERLSIFSDIMSNEMEIPAGPIKTNRETADIFWFISVYLESHLGVPFQEVLADYETFLDYQSALSARRLSVDDYEAAKSEIVTLIDKIGQQYVSSDDMSHRKRYRLGQKILPMVRELLELLVILSINTSRLFGGDKFDLNDELATSLLNNKAKKLSGSNFNIVAEDLTTNGVYSKNARCLRGSKDIIWLQDDARTSFEVIDLGVLVEPAELAHSIGLCVEQNSLDVKTRPVISLCCVLLS